MTGDTVGGSVIGSVTVDTVAHLQVTDLLDLLHASHVSVTGRAGDPYGYVGLVEELDMVWEPVYPLPIDRLIGQKELTKLGQFRAVRQNEIIITQVLVAEQTLLQCRNPCRFARIGGAMAEGTLDAHLFYMNIVGKVYRLVGRRAHSEDLERLGENCFGKEYSGQNYYDTNT